MAVDQTALGVFDLELVVSQMLPDRALQLPEREHGLHQACGPDRMAAGEQATGGIHGKLASLGQFKSIVDRGHERDTAFDEAPALAIFAEAQIFIGLNLRRCVRVVQLDEAQLLSRIADSRHLIGQFRRHATAPERMDAGIFQMAIICFSFMRQEDHLAVRPVCHAHRIGPRTDASNLDRMVAHLGRDFFGSQETHCGAVRHGADVFHRQRCGHHRGLPHLFDREPFGFLRIGIVEGVRVVLDRDHRHLLDRRAEFMHVALDHHGVVSGIESADREVEIGI